MSDDKRKARAGRPRKVMVEHIEYDREHQARVSIDDATVLEYAEAMRSGAVFPPIVLYHDGARYWLADGFHRWHAAQKLDARTIDAQVIEGSSDDARWHAAGANQQHGMRRTNEDKRRAVRLALSLRPSLSDRAIADHCGVSDRFVASIRAETEPSPSNRSQVRIGADGKTYDTSRIGKPSQARQEPVSGDPFDDGPETLPERSAAAPAESGAGIGIVAAFEAADEEEIAEYGSDATGYELPESIHDEYERARETTLAALRDLATLRDAIETMAATKPFKRINQSAVQSAIGALRIELRQSAMPHAVCPMCGGSDERVDCRACGGVGWMTKGQWSLVPLDIRGR